MNDKVKIRNIRDIFVESYQIYKKNWVNLLLFSIGLSILSALVSYLLTGEVVITETTQFDPARVSSPSFILGIVASFLLLMPFALALYKFVYDTAEGDGKDVQSTLNYGYKNLLSFFLVSLLAGLIIILGIILLILPGIYAAVAFSFITPVFIIEGLRGSAVLKRCRELIRGYFWAVFGRIIVLGLFSGFIGALFASSPILSDLVAAALTPFSAAYIYLMYKDLKEIKK